ncbi:hypothetical protein [Micromonospora sp. NPDC005087]|uniref:hypothetical protein n=1 Tax=Micromonospora sp. NPDC005087 TaxID=3364225 RepID=UPI0036898576
MPGAARWWGFAVIVLCGALGWLAFLRLLAEVRQEPRKEIRSGQVSRGASSPKVDPELAEQMRRLVVQRRLRGISARRER